MGIDYQRVQTRDNQLFGDLLWNVPERKTGAMALVGGSAQNFSGMVRTAEFLKNNTPIQNLRVFLPDSVRTYIVGFEQDCFFVPTNPSGSMEIDSFSMTKIESNDYVLFYGDFSKNSSTELSVLRCVSQIEKPMLLSRDAIDMVIGDIEKVLTKRGVILFVSMAQMQKILRAVYYPKTITFSMPLLSVMEVLHKFTLSYNCTIVMVCCEQILVAKSGEITTTALSQTSYTPLSIWSGRLAAKMAAMNIWNLDNSLAASTAAIFY